MGIASWMCLFFQSSKVLCFSKREDDAWDLIAKAKFIIEHLPDFLRQKMEPNQRAMLGFPATNSYIKAYPSTEDAGRSTDATLVIADEWEFHPYAEQNFAAVKPTVDAGGKFLGISTIDKMSLKTFPKKVWYRAKSGENNFKALFFGWRVVPTRTQEWYDTVTKDLSDWQKEQEYPETEAEALSVIKTRAFFDPKIIEGLYGSDHPIEHELSDKYRGLVKIYKLPVIGRRYCGFTDPSDGKDDPHACIFIDGVTGEEVAESHGKVPADQCAQIHDGLVRLYNNAFNSYEINAMAGGKFAETIDNLDTPNRCRRVKPEGHLDAKLYGWWTGKTLRGNMIWGLEEAVRLGQFTPHSTKLLDEFTQFIQPEGEEPQASTGGHDDYVIACGGVFQIRKFMPSGGGRIRSFTYKD